MVYTLDMLLQMILTSKRSFFFRLLNAFEIRMIGQVLVGRLCLQAEGPCHRVKATGDAYSGSCSHMNGLFVSFPFIPCRIWISAECAEESWPFGFQSVLPFSFISLVGLLYGKIYIF